MYPTPTPTDLQQQKTATNSICSRSFISSPAGWPCWGSGGLYLHYLFFSRIMAEPEFRKPFENHPLVNDMPGIFAWFYVFAGVMIGVACLLNILSGIFLRQRKHRIFSFIVAALNCLQVPLGTLLGVFTIITLSRDSVRQLYEESQHTQFYQ